MASLLAYALRLQSDSDEYKKFKLSLQNAKDQMTAAGLNTEQQNILLSGSSDDLQSALIQEISTIHSSGDDDDDESGFVNNCKLTLTFRIPKPPQ